VNFPFTKCICSNIPTAPSYGVYIFQLIRYPRACGSYHDFLDRGLLLTRKLLNQWFLLIKLKSLLRKFYVRHHGFVLLNLLSFMCNVCPFVLFLLAIGIVVSVLRFTDSDYPFLVSSNSSYIICNSPVYLYYILYSNKIVDVHIYSYFQKCAQYCAATHVQNTH